MLTGWAQEDLVDKLSGEAIWAGGAGWGGMQRHEDRAQD
jgi:hypothetical protein